MQGTYLHIDSPKPSFSGSSPSAGNLQSVQVEFFQGVGLIPECRELTTNRGIFIIELKAHPRVQGTY